MVSTSSVKNKGMIAVLTFNSLSPTTTISLSEAAVCAVLLLFVVRHGELIHERMMGNDIE